MIINENNARVRFISDVERAKYVSSNFTHFRAEELIQVNTLPYPSNFYESTNLHFQGIPRPRLCHYRYCGGYRACGTYLGPRNPAS